MNKKKLLSSLHYRIRFRPMPTRTWYGEKQEALDDTWVVNRVYDNGVVQLQNIRTGHVARLGADHIHHFDSDPMSETDNLKHGFFVLTVQPCFIDGEFYLEPNMEKTVLD